MMRTEQTLASLTTLYSLETGRIQRLEGFIKNIHRVPQMHTPATEAFVQKAGQPLIETRSKELFQQIRTHFAFKRTQITLTDLAGGTRISTPLFLFIYRLNKIQKRPGIIT